MCYPNNSVSFLAACLVAAGTARADTWEVPDDFVTIQLAVNSPMVQSGDVILVHESPLPGGAYIEAVVLPAGKVITLRGDGPGIAVIDATGLDLPAIKLVGTPATEASVTHLIEGFTLIGDTSGPGAADNRGAGMHIQDATPTVNDCTFESCFGGAGGGVYSNSAAPTFTNCTFELNEADEGGGMYLNNSPNVQISGCRFLGNEGLTVGGAISNHTSVVTIRESEFRDNVAATAGHGIWTINAAAVMTIVNSVFAGEGQAVYNGNNGTLSLLSCTSTDNVVNTSSSTLTVRNSIVWDASISTGGSVSVTYSLVQGGYAGEGNILDDPMFFDAAGGDLWIQDASPAVDAGDTVAAVDYLPQYALDFDGNDRVRDAAKADTGIAVFSATIDMGAYEVQEGQSVTCPGDLDGDDNVGITDFLQLLSAWGPCP